MTRAPFVMSLINSLLFGVYFYWLSSYKTWQFDFSTYFGAFGGNFYWLQADAMLDGQLHLPTSGFECLVIDGQCHGYFGPFPSLLRIPFVLIFGDTYDGLSPVFLALAAGIALYSFTNLLANILTSSITRSPSWFDLASMQIFIFTMGVSGLLILSAHPRVYEEAVMWSVAFVSIAVNLSYRWFIRQRNIYLFFIMLCGCASVLSKVTAMPFFALLGLFLVLHSIRQRTIQTFIWGCAVGGVPLVVYVSYTLVHLGFLGFDANYYWAYNNILIMRDVIDSNNGITLGVQFLPTVIANHFRLNNIAVIFEWPFITIASDWFEGAVYVWPMKPGQMFIAYSPGLLAVIPGTLIVGVISVVYLVLRRSSITSGNRNILLGLYFAVLANALLSMSYFAMNARYLTDAYPLMSMGIIILATLFFARNPSINKDKIVIICVILLCSVYSAVALASIHVDIVPFI